MPRIGLDSVRNKTKKKMFQSLKKKEKKLLKHHKHLTIPAFIFISFALPSLMSNL